MHSRLVAALASLALLVVVGCSAALKAGWRDARDTCGGACAPVATTVVMAIHNHDLPTLTAAIVTVGECGACVVEAIVRHAHDPADAGAPVALPGPERDLQGFALRELRPKLQGEPLQLANAMLRELQARPVADAR